MSSFTWVQGIQSQVHMLGHWSISPALLYLLKQSCYITKSILGITVIITLTIYYSINLILGVSSYHNSIALPSSLYSQTQEKAKHRSVILSNKSYTFIVRDGLLITKILVKCSLAYIWKYIRKSKFVAVELLVQRMCFTFFLDII